MGLKILKDRIAIYLMFLCGIYTVNCYSQQSSVTNTNYFNLGITHDIFHNVHVMDLKAATQILVEKVVKNVDDNFESSTIIYDDIEELRIDLLNGFLTEIITTSYEYLKLTDVKTLVPMLIPHYGDYFEDRVILLVHKNSNINNLEDLKDKTISLLQIGRGTLELMWFNTILMENNLPLVEDYFSKIKYETNNSQIIYKVFFQNVGACLSSYETFKTLSRLNPQIEKNLKMLYQSEPLVFSVLSLNTIYRTTDEIDLYRTKMTNLDRDPSGKQILKLYKTSKLIPFKDEYLKNIISLSTKYEKLLRKTKN